MNCSIPRITGGSINELIEKAATRAAISYVKFLEIALQKQKFCNFCLQQRPEEINSLLKAGWTVIERQPEVDSTGSQFRLRGEVYWVCKNCHGRIPE